MEDRLKTDHNGSTPSSLDESALSSPSTATTPIITIREVGGPEDNQGPPTQVSPKSDGSDPVDDRTYTITNTAPDQDSSSTSPFNANTFTAVNNTTALSKPLTSQSTPSSSLPVPESPQNQTGSATSKTTDTSTSDDDDVIAVTPPDGGWGWIVVLSSFLIHVIADGVVYTFGIFLIEFVDVFNVGRGPASWIGALQPAVTFTVGPLASALTNRYGCRPVTVLGAIIAGIGFIISVPAPNLYYLYVTAGVMTGLGFGLIYLPAIVSVAQYFEKKRSFATGLAVCGSGFGTFILAPITEMLVAEYSWRGAMLILGGIILNVVVCGLLFRPLEGPSAGDLDKSTAESEDVESEKKKLLSNKSEEVTTLTGTELIPMITATKDEDGTFLIKKHRGDGRGGDAGGGEWQEGAKPSSLEVIPLGRRQNGNHQNVNKNHMIKSAPVGDAGGGGGGGYGGSGVAGTAMAGGSDTDVLITSIETDNGEVRVLDDVASSPTTSDVVLNGFQIHVDFPSEMDDNLREMSASQCLTVPGANKMNGTDPAMLALSDGAIHKRNTGKAGGHKSPHSPGVRRRVRQGSHSSTSSHTHTLAPLSRKDIFYSGSLLNIPMYKSQPEFYLATVTPVSPSHHGKETKDSREQEETDASRNKCFEFSREFKSTMKEMMSFSLMKNPIFLMFGISNFLTSIGFNMPFIFLPDRATLAGIDENDAAYLLSIIGIANTCGRIIFGFLSDRSWVNRLFLYNSALTICGVATALSVILGDSYAAFVAYAAIFGVFIGVYVSLTSVVLVDLLGLEHLTNSFGLLLLFQGAATFVGPPIAGMLYDWTGSYDISFIVMGTLIALSGAMLFLLPCVQRRYDRQVPVVEIIREVEMGRQIQGDSETAEIIRSMEVIPSH